MKNIKFKEKVLDSEVLKYKNILLHGDSKLKHCC